MTSYLSLHASQIQQFVDAVGEPEPAVLVRASTEMRTHAVQALRAAGVEIPKAGAFLPAQLDAALDGAFDKTHPMSLHRRMELKTQVYAGGLVLEKPTNVNATAVVTASLMLKKARIEPPKDRPYTVAEFDELLAAASPSLPTSHRFEIKAAALKAGLVVDPPRKPAGPAPKAVTEARAICERLSLDAPAAGKKLNVVVVEAAMASRGWDANRRAWAKSSLYAGGMLAA
jgi:hypothetical protein